MRTKNGNTRLATLVALIIIATIALFATPSESNNIGTFFLLLLASKGIALLCLYLASRIARNASRTAENKKNKSLLTK